MTLRYDEAHEFENYEPLTNDYEEVLNLPGEDTASDINIAQLSQGDGYPMTEFQTKHFVVGEGLTTYRMKRQALIEIDSRRSSLTSMLRSYKKTSILIEMSKRDIKLEMDPLKAQLLECDLDELEYDVSVWDHKIPQARRELKEMITHLRSLFPDGAPSIEDIKSISKENPQEEREYWKVRMAKQTAVDIATTGRVGGGNLSSIMNLDTADQEVIIQKALEFSTNFESVVNTLGTNARQRLIGQPLDKLNKLNYNEDIQSTTQSKAKSESI